MPAPGPSRDALLDAIAAGRQVDPLAPVTVVAPSHLAALQMRRALAERGPFAAVRFETLPRLAELLGAGRLAAAGRRPMARPIGDHLAERVAEGARSPLDGIAGLPGLARTLRRLFTRLRRAGLRGGEPPPPEVTSPHLREVMRLYGLWRQQVAGFYDEEDLLDAAADAVEDDGRIAAELGALYLVPPGPRSHPGRRLRDALAAARGGIVEAAEPGPAGGVRMILAPDRASEVREAIRAVVAALEEGLALDQVAVLTGADPAYARALREGFEAAEVPISSSPGVPLAETPAGRGVLALLELAASDMSRTAFVDVLGVAPLRREIPAGEGAARVASGRWDRLSRAAGITHGIERWREGIAAWCAEREHDRRDPAGARPWVAQAVAEARELLAVAESLWGRLEGLRAERPAAGFIAAFGALVSDYLDPAAAGTAEVAAEIERLGTIDAVGGTFGLARFHGALRVNLEAAAIRDGRAGEGVLVADHRVAGGLRFRRAVVCGAAEGLLPAGPGADALVGDPAWAGLRRAGLPLVEDAALRLERADEAARRALGCADELVLSCPLYEGAGAHERYPSHLAVEAVRRQDPGVTTAGELRERRRAPWLTRRESPLAAQLRGAVLDGWEGGLRSAVARLGGAPPPAPDPLEPALAMLRARRSADLTAWDGNLAALGPSEWLAVPGTVSPTRLERYGVCGFRFMLDTLLGVRVPEVPGDADALDPLVRGTLVHGALEAFFREQAARERPRPDEAWDAADAARLLEHLAEGLESARRRGLAGLPVFTRQEERRLRADLVTFLAEDSAFRRRTGAVPHAFEERIDVEGPHGQRFTGFVDRVDRGADGRVWIIDYKTGRPPRNGDPLGGGALLQRPVYLLSAPEGTTATAVYWYITARGGFEKACWEATPANLETFAAVVAAIRDGVASGAFPAVPGEWDDFRSRFANCAFCDFTRICPRSREQDLQRKEGHAAVGAWRAVARAAAGEEG